MRLIYFVLINKIQRSVSNEENTLWRGQRSLIPADGYEFKGNLVYTGDSRPSLRLHSETLSQGGKLVLFYWFLFFETLSPSNPGLQQSPSLSAASAFIDSLAVFYSSTAQPDHS